MHLLIGYGNPLRCDDGLGQYLAEILVGYWNVITHMQLTPELAEPISRAERVVFLDADAGERPGKVTCKPVGAMPAAGAFTHNVTPASLLAAAQELYGAAPQALLITITGASFEYSDTFSPQINALLPEIVRTVDECVMTFFAAEDRSGA
jgi:hydrogenase maturation protease